MAKHYPMTQHGDREATAEDAELILDEGEFAVISTVDEDGSPYGVPMSYAMIDGKMYLHTGKGRGHKLENFARDGRVSVCVAIGLEPLFIETFFTTRYASVIASGHVSQVKDPLVMRRALVALCMKYVPDAKMQIGGAIDRELSETTIWEISFEDLRAKAGRWLRG